MTDTSVPAKTVAAPPVVAGDPRKLDDVLLAMDVVDTLRHRTRVVDMELNAEAREQQLIDRLKEIYGAQGIDVPEKILKDGVKALEEQRFVYKPPPPSFGTKLAHLYVSRKKWLPGVAMAFVALIAMGGVALFSVRAGEAEWKRLPTEIARLSDAGQKLAIDPAVDTQIQAMERTGLRAVAENDRGDAKAQLAALKDINAQLAAEYDIRIAVQESTIAFYRIPPNNPMGRNYYIVVEAVPPGGGRLDLPIRNDETGKTERVDLWAQRVGKLTFDKIAEEKTGSGIIQNDVLGHKAPGELKPAYEQGAVDGAITNWND